MNINCNDRERILLDGSSEEWAALEQHANACAACAEQLRAWKQLSVRADELRDYQESPALWSRIESSLRQQQAGPAPPKYGSGQVSPPGWPSGGSKIATCVR